jgi:hypothetical protein
MRHSAARNAIERIFGVLKRRFRILQLPPEYNMRTQVLIPPALAALHNFIREFNPEEIQTFDRSINGDDINQPLDFQMAPHPAFVGELGLGPVTRGETVRANARRDRIAGEMWAQYQDYLSSLARDL